MDDHFTNNSDAVYLASLTQGKKIIFLERELINAQHYTKNLQQSLQSSRLTVNRLIKDRTNHQVLAKMTENLYHMERRCREMQQLLKESNAKLLIEMQLRIQQKAEYHEKVRELEQEIDLIRKNNKDKEQEFTIVVNKLRKYEDIRELTLEEKLSKDSKKNLVLKEDDKQEMIKDLSQELNIYKKMNKLERVEIDKKIAVLQCAMESNESYEALKQRYIQTLNEPNKKFENERQEYEKMILSKKKNLKEKKHKMSENMNDNTKQLLKQIKKLVISNKLLQAALCQSIEKNQELIFNSQILIDSNLEMKQKINEYRKNQHTLIRRKKNSLGNSKDILFLPQKQSISTSSNGKGSKELKKTDNLNFIFGWSESQVYRESRQSHDDIGMMRTQQMNLVEMVRQKQLKEYLSNLKSKDYQVNVEELYKDVNKVSEFLILSLGTRSKSAANNVPTYSSIMRKQDMKKQIRSISSDVRHIQKPAAYETLQSKRSSTSKHDNQPNGLILSNIIQANGDLKEESFHIQQY